jgi:hypothetical protein
MKCEICNKPATVHIVDAGTERHLCSAHASGIVAVDEALYARTALGKLRALVEFMKEHQRTPTPEELASMESAGDISRETLSDPKFSVHLQFLESLMQFIEREGRMPTEQEIGPDPW